MSQPRGIHRTIIEKQTVTEKGQIIKRHGEFIQVLRENCAYAVLIFLVLTQWNFILLHVTQWIKYMKLHSYLCLQGISSSELNMFTPPPRKLKREAELIQSGHLDLKLEELLGEIVQ